MNIKGYPMYSNTTISMINDDINNRNNDTTNNNNNNSNSNINTNNNNMTTNIVLRSITTNDNKCYQ